MGRVFGEVSGQQVPCNFIFRDSLAYNNGNNNYLHTLARVNFARYGIDFPSGRTHWKVLYGSNNADVIYLSHTPFTKIFYYMLLN